MNKSKSLQDLNLVDSFLFSASTENPQNAELIAKLIIERATGRRIKEISVMPEKQLLKTVGQGKEKEDDDMCEAIQGMIDEGKAEGQNRMLLLLACMGKNNELHLVSKLQDAEFLEQMYAKYQV